jgi:hypothetical protein
MVDRPGVGIGDIDEEFDRWFVKQLEQTELGNLLDMPNDELMEAGVHNPLLRPDLRVDQWDGRRDV